MTNSTPDHSNYDQSIFDFTPFPMWIYDLETFRFLAVNKEAIRYYGYSKEQFFRMTIKDIRPEEDIPRLENAVRNASKRTDLYKQSLFRHKKCNGAVMYVQIKSNLINFKGKKAEIVTAIDLTDRYEKEQKIETQKEYLKVIGFINQLLLKSEDWLESLSTSFKIVGETLDIDRIYFFQNNLENKTTSQRMVWSHANIKSQINNSELQNIPLSQFLLFMEPLQKKRRFEAIVDNLPSSSTKDILLQQNIKSILVLPLFIHDIFYGFIGFDDCERERKFSEDEFQLLYALTSNLNHVIKQHQVYTELSHSEGRFKSLIENGKDLIAIIDSNAHYKYVSPTSSHVLGLSPEEFLGTNAFDYIHEQDTPRIKEQLGLILKSKHVTIEPYRFLDAHGNWRWIRTELTNHLSTPFINGIVANTHEVTQEVKKRQIEELVASISRSIGHPENTFSACFQNTINKLLEIDKIDVSEIWLVSTDNSQLNLIASASSNPTFEVFHQLSKDRLSYHKGEGLIGEIWETKTSCLWKDFTVLKSNDRSKAAKAADLRTGMGFPILYNEKLVGCIACFSSYHIDALKEEFTLLENVIIQLGAVVKQKITEDEYRNFFNITPDPQCVLGFDGYIKKSNKAFLKLMEYGEKELLTTPILQFIHKEDQQESQNRLKASLGQNKQPGSFEARFITKSGKIKWLVWSGTVVSESKIIVAVAKDITEQKFAEKELKLAYDRLTNAQKIAKLGYWVRDLDSDISVWGDETYEIYELSPQEFTPTMEKVIQLFHPEDRYLVDSDPTEHLEPDKLQGFEHRILTGTGKVKWVHEEIRLLTDAQGVAFRIEGTIQDITERKEYEEQLALSNERFRLAMQASNEMIWEVDHLKQIVTRGSGYKQTFNYDKCEAFSKSNSWFSKIHPDDLGNVWTTLQIALDNKDETFWKCEYRIQSEDGSTSYFIDRCHILRDKKGSPLRSVGSALDVTISRQQLEHIKEQNENLREIAWLQSHVIRSPLSRIMGLIYLANELEGGGKSTGDIMELITQSANELDGVIRRITNKINLIKDDDTRNSISR
ncbi:PAS domain-containing protein [Owenweeksia hongkongensis]|uniref:PAS domain S-box protein n=1 Tax=Owenweeksia hongkongensis TaxID=253245 RepID=UPI003A8DCC37